MTFTHSGFHAACKKMTFRVVLTDPASVTRGQDRAGNQVGGGPLGSKHGGFGETKPSPGFRAGVDRASDRSHKQVSIQGAGAE